MTLDTVTCGDALEWLTDLPSGIGTLAVVDGPYNMRKAEWDKFPTWEAFREWYAPYWQELSRVLRDNCSLYVFGTFEGLAALKQDLDALEDGWRFGSAITLDKGPVWKQVSNSQARTWPSCAEYLLVYHREPQGGFGPGGAISKARKAAGLRATDVDVALGYVRSADSTRGTELCRRWEEGSSLPSRKDFLLAMNVCGSAGDYDVLRCEYETSRYAFNPQRGVTDVWNVPICAGAERVRANGETAHVTQKPLAIMRRIIQASSNEGDTVIVPFSGLGSCEVACADLGRRFAGCELDQGYVEIARARIAKALRSVQPALALEAP